MGPGISIILSPADRRRLEALVGDRSPRSMFGAHGSYGALMASWDHATGKSKTCVWRWQEKRATICCATRSRPGGGRAGGRPDAERRRGAHWVGDGQGNQRQLGAAHLARSSAPSGAFKLSNDPASSPNCAMWSGSTSTRRPTPSCSRSTKSRRSRRSTAPSPAPMKKGRLGTMTHARHDDHPVRRPQLLEGKVIALHAAPPPPGVHRTPSGRYLHVILASMPRRAWLGRHERFTFHFDLLLLAHREGSEGSGA